jgi:hypothetical protein
MKEIDELSIFLSTRELQQFSKLKTLKLNLADNTLFTQRYLSELFQLRQIT